MKNTTKKKMKNNTFLLILLCLSALFILSCAPAKFSDFENPVDARGRTFHVKTPLKALWVTRDYLAHIPASWDGEQPLPVVIALHGAFMTAAEMEKHTGLSALADRENFMVVYPNGMGIAGFLQHWNAGFCCGKAQEEGIDDAAFIDYCLSDLEQIYPLDTSRMYILGVSNGGMLAYQYAAQRPDKIAALTVIVGGLPENQELYIPPKDALPLCIIHGRQDETIPYHGGYLNGAPDPDLPTFMSTQKTAKNWALRNGCDDSPQSDYLHEGRVLFEEWRHCRNNANVALYTIENFTHEWPGGEHVEDIPTQNGVPLDAADIAWRFMAPYSIR